MPLNPPVSQNHFDLPQLIEGVGSNCKVSRTQIVEHRNNGFEKKKSTIRLTFFLTYAIKLW